MKKVSNLYIVAVAAIVSMAIVFQAGRIAGFRTGSEWALVQAEIVAREAGVSMPVYLEQGKFRVVIKQRRGLYKRAWQRADAYEELAALRASKAVPVSTKGRGIIQKTF